MRTRLDLDKVLREIAGTGATVYFQPPANTVMKYPAIRYSRYDIEAYHADNAPYIMSPGYQITVIDANPDSEYVEKVMAISGCRYDRNYVADNLNHDVFTVYLN